ncbi:MAG TPA: Clp protease N-terminal domain-containing protein [Acidimicrobiales bacterium]|nr:Clp protease N-terminal domain-containing protein [Acidimicrobiales bacterium]
MFERFTDRARTVLVLAQEEARLLEHSFIGTEHILLGVLREGDGVGAEALRSLGVSYDAVRQKVVETIGMAGTAPSGSPPFTPRAKKVMELSLREALQLNHSYIGTEHILLGLAREGEGVAARVLVELGADLLRVRQAVNDILTAGPAARPAATVREPEHAAEALRDPSCPGCSALLVDAARFRTLSVPPDDEKASPMSVHVVYCRHCGTTLHMFKQDAPGEPSPVRG